MNLSREEIEQLRTLEESLWVPATRFDESWMRDTLAPDFREFGRSGRTYDLEATLAPRPSEIPALLPLPEFQAVLLAPDVALITYDSVLNYAEGIEVAHRSSVWTRTNGKWRLRFHQGTAVPAQL